MLPVRVLLRADLGGRGGFGERMTGSLDEGVMEYEPVCVGENTLWTLEDGGTESYVSVEAEGGAGLCVEYMYASTMEEPVALMLERPDAAE